MAPMTLRLALGVTVLPLILSGCHDEPAPPAPAPPKPSAAPTSSVSNSGEAISCAVTVAGINQEPG